MKSPQLVWTTSSYVVPASSEPVGAVSPPSAFARGRVDGLAAAVRGGRGLLVVAAARREREREDEGEQREQERASHDDRGSYLERCGRSRHERTGDLDLEGRAVERRGGVELVGEESSHGIGAAPASAIRVSPPTRAAATPTRANAQRCRSIAFRYDARLDLGQLELEDQLVGSERRGRAIVLGRAAGRARRARARGGRCGCGRRSRAARRRGRTGAPRRRSRSRRTRARDAARRARGTCRRRAAGRGT